MLNKIVECVPNFSEGRKRDVIDRIVDAVRQTPGCKVVDVEAGASTNRTVVTFVGAPDACVEGALALVAAARKLIDMRQHHGEHPRIGAVDVVPFVPVSNVTSAECVECAKRFGQRAADQFGIPVFMYEDAASKAYRTKLSQIREGEYEHLPQRLAMPEWAPDFGPARFLPEYGATCAGARFYLLAYNVNVLSTKEHAHRIALNIREQGRGPGQEGRLKKVKAIGWYVEEHQIAQVSMNLDNFQVTGLHTAFEACKEEAAKLGVGVAGSELVGMVPLNALIDAANFYIEREHLMIVDERTKVRLAVERLGLNSLAPFDINRRVIEYIIRDEMSEPLANSTVRGFIEKVASRSPTPGGGSVSALVAACGSGLGAMVGWLTYGRRAYEREEPIVRQAIPVLHDATQALIKLIDTDAQAFNRCVDAMKMTDPMQKAAAYEAALRNAVETPLSTMATAFGAWSSMKMVASVGNMQAISDAQVGAKCLAAGIWGACKNVQINLAQVHDDEYRRRISERAAQILAESDKACEEVLAICLQRESDAATKATAPVPAAPK